MKEIRNRKYLTVREVQNEYLPISSKKLRAVARQHLRIKYIGGRIYIDRDSPEQYLKETGESTGAKHA